MRFEVYLSLTDKFRLSKHRNFNAAIFNAFSYGVGTCVEDTVKNKTYLIKRYSHGLDYFKI
jgi:hypothetical protein